MSPFALTLIASSSLAATVDGARLEQLFGFSGRVTVTEVTTPTEPLPFTLLGTLRAARPEHSLASVEYAKKALTLRVGDELEGVRLVEIEQQALIVERQGRRERVGRGPFVPRAPEPPRPGVKTVTKQEVITALANPAELMRDVRLMPAMVDGKWAGFRAAFVREGSAVATLGLKSGDVIRAVNGRPLDSAERIGELLQALQQSRRFVVELERGGQRVSQSIDLE